MSCITKKVVSFIGLLANIILVVVLRKAFEVWGIFDPFSEWLGGWMKMHITPAQIEWTVAAGVALIAYAWLLWIVWRHHRAPQGVNQASGVRNVTAIGASIDEVRKAVAPDAPSYMTAYEVIHYLADDSEWGNEIRQYVDADGMRKNTLLEAQAEFKRIAEQGGIHAVGRLNGIGQHVEIPETYWLSATINPFSLYNRGISQTIPAVPNPDGIPIYKNVMILRADVEHAWPRCSIIAIRIPLLDLLHEAESMGWSLQNRDVSQRFAHGLRQAAVEEAIEIWGRDLKDGWDLKSAPHIYPSERIAPTYFKDHWIEVQQALAHQLNAYTRTSRPAGNESRLFADLYVDRLQALEWLRSEGIRLRDTA